MGNNLIVIGGPSHPDKRKNVAIVRDAHGEVEVNMDFAFANPHVYYYCGVLNVNDERRYYFEYMEGR